MRECRIIIHNKAFTQGGSILCLLGNFGHPFRLVPWLRDGGESVGSYFTAIDQEKQKRAGAYFCHPLIELAYNPSGFKE